MTGDGHTRVLLVTGVSGAGKTTALKALEDLGYEAVDNLPLSVIGRVVPPAGENLGGDGAPRPIALGVDIRTREFEAGRFFQVLEELDRRDDVVRGVLFLDCDNEVLGRRFEETRRRHPLAADRPIRDGIDQERQRMAPVRERADVIIDTTEMTFGELKQTIEGHFGVEAEGGLAIFVTSFSFRAGLPRDADLVFDVRFLANPHYIPALRNQTGRDTAVGEYIGADPSFQSFLDNVSGLLLPLLPRYRAEGKSYLTIAIGCTGGRHRSVFVAERLAAWLDDAGWPSRLRHRDLEK